MNDVTVCVCVSEKTKKWIFCGFEENDENEKTSSQNATHDDATNESEKNPHQNGNVEEDIDMTNSETVAPQSPQNDEMKNENDNEIEVSGKTVVTQPSGVLGV